MRAWLKKCWPIGKLVLGLAVLYFIGRRFAADLQDERVWRWAFDPGWLALSGALYILGFSFSVFFWYRLLRHFGQQMTFATALRAYFIGHLGKYLPGKAMALVMRATLAAGPGVRVGLAGLTAFYEVLTTMATGALLGAMLLFAFLPPVTAPIDWNAFWGLFRLEEPTATVLDRRVFVLFALFLFAVLGTFTVPPIINRLGLRFSRSFREKDAPPLPRFRFAFLGEGMLLTACGWFFLGASLWALLNGVLDVPPLASLRTWGSITGFMGVSYVAGFIILVLPSGLGVREFFLVFFLADSNVGGPRPSILLAVLLLRIVWTTAELVMATIVYWLPRERGGARFQS
jgi:hypothetical protein